MLSLVYGFMPGQWNKTRSELLAQGQMLKHFFLHDKFGAVNSLPEVKKSDIYTFYQHGPSKNEQ